MHNKLLTIVIPVYKVEPYIKKCLDSLIVATSLMENIEVIIVNDGTPDNSAKMSRGYVNRYPSVFRQIDKENGGHGSAWNVGLHEARGKYLRFLDSDDWLSNLGQFINDLSATDADIVFTKYARVYSDKGTTVIYNNPISPGRLHELSDEMWGKSEHDYEAFNFWSATYKTRILQPLYPLFAEDVMYDDYILTLAPLIYGRNCISFDYVLYNYLLGRQGQSMMSTVSSKASRSYKLCLEQYESLLAKTSDVILPETISNAIDRTVIGYAHLVFQMMLGLGFKGARQEMRRIASKYPWKSGADMPHFVKRYFRFPFPIFYLIEKGREVYLKIRYE